MQYHYVGKLMGANVFLPYVFCKPAYQVSVGNTSYPRAMVWAVFAFSPGLVGILFGVYLGIVSADLLGLFSNVAVFAFFGQLLFGVPAALTGGVAAYFRWRKTVKHVLASALVGGGLTWAIGFVVTNDVAVATGYAAIGLGVALVVALWVLPKSRIKSKR